MKRINFVIVSLAILCFPWPGVLDAGLYFPDADYDDTGTSHFDLSFNRVISLPVVRIDIKRVTLPQVDSYWVDSWTSDGDATPWYTPEKYSFTRGDVVECVFQFQQTPGEYQFIRYDGFYFCGETNPRNYIAYGWADFGTIPPN